MEYLFFYLIAALTVSFLCSLMESTLLSVTHAYIAVLVRNGDSAGPLLRRMKRNINHPLSAILTLNTVANVVGASGVGAEAYKLFGSRWVALTSALLTVLILVFSEIIPKTIGAVYWKRIAPTAAILLNGMIVLTYPVVLILEGISRLVAGKTTQPHLNRDEFMVLADLGQSEGVLLEKEARIMKNLFLLGKIRAGDIMTPRAVMFALHKDDTVLEVIDRHSPIPFARIPVYDTGLDDIVGVVHRRALLEAYHAGHSDTPVEQFAVPLHAIPESKPIADLMDEFIQRREHIFLVIGEHGGTDGIVTLEDAIETLLGVEIVDETDSVEDMRSLALERWRSQHSQRKSL